jgi:hypothetical protein
MVRCQFSCEMTILPIVISGPTRSPSFCEQGRCCVHWVSGRWRAGPLACHPCLSTRRGCHYAHMERAEEETGNRSRRSPERAGGHDLALASPRLGSLGPTSSWRIRTAPSVSSSTQPPPQPRAPGPQPASGLVEVAPIVTRMSGRLDRGSGSRDEGRKCLRTWIEGSSLERLTPINLGR